jgi:hypothetical protein
MKHGTKELLKTIIANQELMMKALNIQPAKKETSASHQVVTAAKISKKEADKATAKPIAKKPAKKASKKASGK